MSEIESHEVIVRILGPVPDWSEGEIVRCRDCDRYEYDCDWNNPDLENPDGFCAWAVRKVDA